MTRVLWLAVIRSSANLPCWEEKLTYSKTFTRFPEFVIWTGMVQDHTQWWNFTVESSRFSHKSHELQEALAVRHPSTPISTAQPGLGHEFLLCEPVYTCWVSHVLAIHLLALNSHCPTASLSGFLSTAPPRSRGKSIWLLDLGYVRSQHREGLQRCTAARSS